jgi:hypothetical protein
MLVILEDVVIFLHIIEYCSLNGLLHIIQLQVQSPLFSKEGRYKPLNTLAASDRGLVEIFARLG